MNIDVECVVLMFICTSVSILIPKTVLFKT